MTVENIKQEYDGIFDAAKRGPEELKEIADRGYAFAEPKTASVLFIGINPSYREGDPTARFAYSHQDAVRDYPTHFGRFQDLAKLANVAEDWAYWDLLPMRETNQQKAAGLTGSKPGVEFICQQLRVTMAVIEAIAPKLIVVCNRTAGTFFGKDKSEKGGEIFAVWMGYEFQFNQSFGLEVITGLHPNSIKRGVKSTGLDGTPVLFTSTLTYMTSAEKKRIGWQIRQALKYYDLFFGKENHHSHRSTKITNQLKHLLVKTVDARNLGANLVEKGRYEEAARARDTELDYLEDIVELLLKSDMAEK